MRQTIRILLLPALLAGLLSACSDQRGDLTPFTQSTMVGVGYEVFKARVERRLEMTCNLENIVTEGAYCVSNYKPTDRQEVFCFKTLGSVDCYAEPDPYSLEGRQLPGPPRTLADPRMPMTPPGRRPVPQIATAPYDSYNSGYSEPATMTAPADGPSPASSSMTEPEPDPATRPM
ncbi:MAG: hypothetical protein OJJ21_23605 [Ferrovibrio sp.]|uniref:hypothetical protein n=1 Tax=Ferrovibrio sp. TaxID=1917215 RepID=UPI002618C573|nr:hypothetical protein [Ferrovibrio sp.]MCW0236603.1 hypothetical protein [Ferrovibrio sp.]